MILLDYLIYHLRPYYGLSGPIERRPSTPEPPPDILLDATPWTGPADEITEQSNTENITTTSSRSPASNDSVLAITADVQTTIATTNRTDNR